MSRLILIVDHGNQDESGDALDLYGYIQNELDAHKVQAFIQELRWTAELAEAVYGATEAREHPAFGRLAWLADIGTNPLSRDDSYWEWLAECLDDEVDRNGPQPKAAPQFHASLHFSAKG